MSPGESIKSVYSNYANFKGRAMRSEFWWYTLFNVVVGTALDVVIPAVSSIWTLANLLPALAVTARRLHDVDRSGWWMLLPLLCLPVLVPAIVIESAALMWIGGAIGVALYIRVIVWHATVGTQGANRFGEDPLGRVDADVFT
ncbi:MAG: DUF805 domain-containing protein [Pseudomonadota bacterium]